MWHYPRITTDTLYSSRGLPCVLHCTAAPAVTVMPVDRGDYSRWRIRLEAPSTNESRAAKGPRLPKGSLVAQHSAGPSLACVLLCKGRGA